MSDPFRTIIGIENRTAQEVFDILCDRFKSHDASQKAEIYRLRAALEYAQKGLDMVHEGLKDPTRPRQAVGEVCNHFLISGNAALPETSNGR